MIKGIKGGLSHARKDKIKIQYDIELKSIINVCNDIVGQDISIKWERGKKFKGQTKECKVVKFQSPPTTAPTSPTSSSPSKTTPDTEKDPAGIVKNNPKIITSGVGSQQQHVGKKNDALAAPIPLVHSVSTGSIPTITPQKYDHSTLLTPNINYKSHSRNSSATGDSAHEASNISATTGSHSMLSRKQSKLLLGNRIDGTNSLLGGDGVVCLTNCDKITFRVTLFSSTTHSKQDYSLHPNYEQKLLYIYLLNKNNVLCHTSIDLSLHTEDHGSIVQVPFPSSSPNQPTLHMNIKTDFLKYNDKTIIKASPEMVSKKDILGSISPNGANKLIEIEGEVYIVDRNNNSSSNNNNSSTAPVTSGSSNNKNKIAKKIQENSNLPIPIISTSNKSNSEMEELAAHPTISDNSYSGQTTSWDDYTETEPISKTMDELNHNHLISMKNNEIKELNMKIKDLQEEINGNQRLHQSLLSVIEDCKSKVMEYEESVYRAQSLENFVKNQLILERFEFKKKIKQLATKYSSPNAPLSPIDSNPNTPTGLSLVKKELEEKNKIIVEKEKNIENITILLDSEKAEKEQIIVKHKQALQENEEHLKKLEKLKETIDKLAKESNDRNLIVENEARKKAAANHTVSKDKSFKDHLIEAAKQKYPSLLYNPVLAWSFAIFCFAMFVLKSFEC
ncbi:hypothetical protein CYY_003251 [Polysphondylium violaceum]|uniref:C2 NT-type domain-containing protein n=1 Tax=Polysphondylium violaceum TaxID=133409 RepID=A0A8J4V633_9MYCE|nr:hypothetical protein CYY_003251 [Polysphondylium violaceum]